MPTRKSPRPPRKPSLAVRKRPTRLDSDENAIGEVVLSVAALDRRLTALEAARREPVGEAYPTCMHLEPEAGRTDAELFELAFGYRPATDAMDSGQIKGRRAIFNAGRADMLVEARRAIGRCLWLGLSDRESLDAALAALAGRGGSDGG